MTILAIADPLPDRIVAFARRGSQAAQAVWLGALAYSVYNYAYFAFGADFNDVFVLHIWIDGSPSVPWTGASSASVNG